MGFRCGFVRNSVRGTLEKSRRRRCETVRGARSVTRQHSDGPLFAIRATSFRPVNRTVNVTEAVGPRSHSGHFSAVRPTDISKRDQYFCAASQKFPSNCRRVCCSFNLRILNIFLNSLFLSN